MIDRVACSHGCETDKPTPDETDAAVGSRNGPPREPPQFLHALLYDHAPVESFWGSPKTKQARLGYLSSADLTQQFFKNQPAA
jgi:hypothetical protein